MQTKTIYFSGLPKSEQILLESYMELLVLRDGSRFDVTDVMEQAQIEVFDPSHAVHSIASPTMRSRIAYLAQGAEGSAHAWALHRPARLSTLREVLSSITTAQAILSKSVPAVPEHRKLEYWLALLARFESEGEAWELRGFKDLRVRIYFNHKRVYLSSEQKWREQLVCTGRALATAIPRDIHFALDEYSVSIDKFRWQLCGILTGGLLLPGIASRVSFAVLHWPDFGSLGASAEQMKLSALFHGRDLSIAKAADISKLSVSTVIDFINACAALGLLKDCPTDLLGREALRTSPALNRLAPAPVPAAKQKTLGFRHLLGKLRGAFGLKS